MNHPRSNADEHVDETTDAERLAIRTGITGDQAQALIDRVGGGDMEALEAEARELKKRGGTSRP
ncbi:MAG: hypothetical protein ACTHLP_15865 [Rhizobiaceae bacterium]|jgi:hypothetical protein